MDNWILIGYSEDRDVYIWACPACHRIVETSEFISPDFSCGECK